MFFVRKDLKIFIGHKENHFLESVQDCLKNDFTVLISNNGIDIVNHILETQPDLAILDYAIPEIDVLKWCEKLSMDHPHITTVIYVALPELMYAKQKWRQRALDYIIGPIGPEEFAEEVNKILRFLIIEREREMLIRNKIEFSYVVNKSIAQLKQSIQTALAHQSWDEVEALSDELSALKKHITDFDLLS
jgi:DNA-binding NtrC family response regulator